MVDRGRPLALQAGMRFKHQQQVAHEIPARPAPGIHVGHCLGKVQIVEPRSKASRKSPFVLAGPSQRHVGILPERVSLELRQMRREHVRSEKREDSQQAGSSALVGRRAGDGDADAPGIGLSDLAAAGDVLDGIRLDALWSGDVGIRAQQPASKRLVGTNPQMRGRVVIRHLDRVDRQPGPAFGLESQLPQTDDLLHLAGVLVHKGLPCQTHIQVQHDFHAVCPSVFNSAFELVVHLGPGHLGMVPDAGGEHPVGRMFLMEVNEWLVAVRFEVRSRPEPAADPRPGGLDDILLLPWKLDSQPAPRVLPGVFTGQGGRRSGNQERAGDGQAANEGRRLEHVLFLYRSTRPPLMSIVAPVMNPATGLATKTITRAISSGSAKRPESRWVLA